jgi:hypothetical protein
MKIRITFIAALFALIGAVNAQDVKFKTKFFSLKEPRFSLGAGLEGGGVFRFLSNNSYTYITDNSPKSRPLYGGSVDFDVYSPYSKVGLYFPVNATVNYARFNGNDNYNEFSTTNLDIPLYFKFRFGARNAAQFLWCAVGASYDIRTSSMTSFGSLRNDSTGINYIKSGYSNLFRNTVNLGAIVGWELFNKGEDSYRSDSSAKARKWRAVIFVRGAYSLQNTLNDSYFTNGTNSVLSEYSKDTKIKYLTVSAGVKVFFRFPKKAPVKHEDEEIIEEKDQDNTKENNNDETPGARKSEHWK